MPLAYLGPTIFGYAAAYCVYSMVSDFLDACASLWVWPEVRGMKKQSSTLKWEAKRFCKWRKDRGGAVYSLHGEARGAQKQRVNCFCGVDGLIALDVLFERNERQGRYA